MKSINAVDTENNTPLYYAIKNKKFRFINKLLDLDANIFVEDSEGHSYLDLILEELNNQVELRHKSSKTNNITNETLLACLKNIEKLWQDQYYHAGTVVFSIIKNKLNSLLEWIYNDFSSFSEFKFDPSTKDCAGFCPLHIAIELSNLDAINVLLDNNADINAKDKNGRTAIHHAVQYKKNQQKIYN